LGENNSTFLIAYNNVDYALAASLEKLKGALDSTPFFRINRKFIVNKKFIKEIQNNNEMLLNITINLDLKNRA
jgi:DNA-binding LytR/AlgR family response regulator